MPQDFSPKLPSDERNACPCAGGTEKQRRQQEGTEQALQMLGWLSEQLHLSAFVAHFGT